MELFQTGRHYIIHNGEQSLWCDRNSGAFEAKTGEDLCSAWNPICIGKVYGVIGKVQIHPDSEWKLILIRHRTLVGTIAQQHDIYRIDKIALVSLSNVDPTDLELELCEKHHFGIKKPGTITQGPDDHSKPLQKTWNSIKSAAENVKIKKKDDKDKDKFEKRILEELHKMYNDSDFFYYSHTYDLTNSLQRQHSENYDKSAALWKRVDDRFFWNKHLLQELMNVENSLADPWILPIIQGFIQMERCKMDFDENQKKTSSDSVSNIGNTRFSEPLEYNICILSRRSKHRAGTRLKRRGIDQTGACANYVETEQIIEFSPHLVSFVQVRGSIPVFWSQTGFKYRPPPRLDKGEEETHEAFVAHVDAQLSVYKKVVILSLAELSGKETVVGDAFLRHILWYNSPDLTYVTFDFHEYCRGMKFENVSILTDGLRDIIKDMRYCWVDNKGIICEQKGVFRVNCIDCLDRTNVVQTAIARIVMETQFRKLGLLPPEEVLPLSCRLAYQQLWANNGDVISHQYAGTAALKGDFTRTGERKLTGMMKDGMNSANRYYLRFKDAHRQAAIDLTLGQPVSEDVLSLSSKNDAEEEDSQDSLLEKEENVKTLIEDTKKMLITEPEQCLGGWSLVNADPIEGDPSRQEVDIILLLTQRAVYVTWYDDEEEQVTRYQRIFLEDLEKLEIGQEPSVFKSRFVCLRLYYRHFADEGFFHTFRAPNTRLFNNIVVAVKDKEEARESLKAVCQAFVAAQEILSLELEVVEKQKLDRKKPLPHPEIQDIHKQQQENSLSGINLPRDVSSEIATLDPNAEDAEENKELEKMCAKATTEKVSPSRMKRVNFLSTGIRLPKPSLPSINNSSFKITLPKMNLPNLNPVRMVKEGSAGKVAIKFSKMLDFTDKGGDDVVMVIDTKTQQGHVCDPAKSGSLDAEDDVLLGSCGILAAAPNNMSVSSGDKFHKHQPDELDLTVKETDLSHSKGDSIINSHGKDVVHENGEWELKSNCTEHKMKGSSASVGKHASPEKELHARTEEEPGMDFVEEHFTKVPPSTGESDELTSILHLPKMLHHSNMKVSLSDSSLSMLDEKMALAVPDTSTFAKLKNKMTSFNFPGSGSFRIQGQPPRGMVRKSQRALEHFEYLVKEKLGNAECQTRIIFI